MMIITIFVGSLETVIMDDLDDFIGYNGDLKHDMMVDYFFDDDEDDMNRPNRRPAVVTDTSRSYSGGDDGVANTFGERIKRARLNIARQRWRIDDLEERIKVLTAELDKPSTQATRRAKVNRQIESCRSGIERAKLRRQDFEDQLASLLAALAKVKRRNVKIAVGVAVGMIVLITAMLLFL